MESGTTHSLAEDARLATLNSYHILDTPPEEQFDRITRMATATLDAPMAFISFIDDKRQWFKSRIGSTASETPCDNSFCSQTILEKEIFVIEDTQKDDRFADHPLVTSAPNIRFYAGAPLITKDGHCLGSLCIADVKPRYFTEKNKQILEGWARLTMDVLDNRRRAKKARHQDQDYLALAEKVARFGYWRIDIRQNVLLWSDEVFNIHGVAQDSYAPALDTAMNFYHQEDRAAAEQALTNAVKNNEPFEFEARIIRPTGEVRTIISKGECQLNKDGRVASVFGVVQDVTDQRAIDDAIKSAKERYEIAIQSADTGIWEYDIPNGVLSWSDIIHDILDTLGDHDETSGDFIERRLHPDDKEDVQSALERCVITDTPFSINFRIKHQDGHYVTLKARGDVVHDEVGAPVSIAGSFVDITEEQRAENLRQDIWKTLTDQHMASSDKLQFVLAKTAAYFDLRFGLINRVNETTYVVEHSFCPRSEISPGDRGPLERSFCSHVLNANRPLAFHDVEESEFHDCKNYDAYKIGAYIGAPLIIEGKQYGTLSFFSPDERNHPFSKPDLQLIELVAQWLGYEIGRDRNLRCLSESEERFSLAVEGSSVGVWDWEDVTKDNEIWSDQYYRLLGYEPGAIKAAASTFQERLHPDDLWPVQNALAEHFKQRSPYNVEFRLRCKNGDYRWFLGSGQAVWDEFGAARRMIGSLMDIHARKTAESLKTEFVSTVSHELRTPMTSIIGAIDLVRSGKFGDLNDNATQLLNIASTNGERLVRLINDILDIEKIESGNIKLERRFVDANQLVRNAIDQNAAFIKSQDVTISARHHSADASIHADSDRMMQVLTNLISNAAKFSGPGGKIDIETRLQGENILIMVADNGPGVPPHKLDAVFAPFVQLDNPESPAPKGTGLGLSITKAIIDAHGGDVSVESKLGDGARFIISLPANAAHANSENKIIAASADRQSKANRRNSILHVEDNEDAASVLSHLISDIADINVAPTLDIAKLCLRKNPYDLIVLDLRLGDERGEEILSHLQNNDAPPPVVIYSAEDVAENDLPDFVVGSYVKSRIPHSLLRNKLAAAINAPTEQEACLG